jgi:hypothetical protein
VSAGPGEPERTAQQLAALDALREQAILASLAGFPFLIVFAGVWTAAGVLTYALPAELAPWAYVALGMPAMPLAMGLERRLGYVRPSGPDPLLPLTLQILFVQVVAFPAILLVWDTASAYVPVAFAAIVGAHFLPFEWVYRTRLYRFLGIAVAVGPFALALLLGERALHATGFFVGAALLAGALAARAHARAVWLAAAGSQAAVPSRGR